MENVSVINMLKLYIIKKCTGTLYSVDKIEM